MWRWRSRVETKQIHFFDIFFLGFTDYSLTIMNSFKTIDQSYDQSILLKIQLFGTSAQLKIIHETIFTWLNEGKPPNEKTIMEKDR